MALASRSKNSMVRARGDARDRKKDQVSSEVPKGFRLNHQLKYEAKSDWFSLIVKNERQNGLAEMKKSTLVC